MWKPTYVIEEHKSQAKLVWAGLLVALVGFTVYQSTKMGLKRFDPDTSFTVSDDIFQFPYTEICFFRGLGCDANADPSGCIATVINETTDSCNNEILDVFVTSEYSNCVAFDLESVDLGALEDRCPSELGRKPSITIFMHWTTSEDIGGESNYTSSVLAFLGKPDGGQQLAYLPYTNLVLSDEDNASEARVAQTLMAVGKNVRKKLSGSSITSYPVLTVATTDHVFASQSDLTGGTFGTTAGGDVSTGYLLLTLTLGSFASTELSDINPTDLTKILGLISSIGGFWGLLLTGWGLIFIATVQHKPEEKARNFKKDIDKGKSFIVRMKSSRTGGVASDAEGGGEEQPTWDIAHGGPRPATDTTNGVRVSENATTA